MAARGLLPVKLNIIFPSIPKSCPIPRNIVGLIGGIPDAENGPSYALWKDGQEIIIQAPPSKHLIKNEDPETWDYSVEVEKLYAYYLERIQALLPYIEFGKSNYAYLLPSRDSGGYHIVHKEKKLRQLTCPQWASRIQLGEITFTVFGCCSDRRGIWNGKEVDILYAWNDVEFKYLDNYMVGYRMVQGLDLTFEVYGHLVGRDGSVIGIVTEAAWGRMIQPKDKTLIYQTVARLQSNNIIYGSCLHNSFLIAGDKVRLIQPGTLFHFDDVRRGEEQAERSHWGALKQLFWEFDYYGPYGYYRIPLTLLNTCPKQQRYIPPLPSPERPLGGIYFRPGFFQRSGYEIHVWPDYTIIDDSDEDDIPELKWRKLTNTSQGRGRIPQNRRIRNRLFLNISHPYYRSSRNKALTNSDDTESTICEVEQNGLWYEVMH